MLVKETISDLHCSGRTEHGLSLMFEFQKLLENKPLMMTDVVITTDQLTYMCIAIMELAEDRLVDKAVAKTVARQRTALEKLKKDINEMAKVASKMSMDLVLEIVNEGLGIDD